MFGARSHLPLRKVKAGTQDRDLKVKNLLRGMVLLIVDWNFLHQLTRQSPQMGSQVNLMEAIL